MLKHTKVLMAHCDVSVKNYQTASLVYYGLNDSLIDTKLSTCIQKIFLKLQLLRDH